MTRKRSELKYQMKLYGPAAVLVVAAFVVAYQFIKPAPPRHVVMATGSTAGAYHAFAQRYAEYFAKEGITLELRPTAGSVENIELLKKHEVDIAFVQGGVEDPASAPELRSLGSMYYEPLWLFHHNDVDITQLRQLKGLRVAVGPQGSGTRALVMRLLEDNAVVDSTDLREMGGKAAIDALIAGELDAAFFVISADSPLIRNMLSHPDLSVTDFTRAAAYARRYRFLSVLELPEGAVDLAHNIPPHNVHLLAPTANLVARPDLHPAIAGLILQAATEVHRDGGWFESNGKFPMPKLLAFPLSDEAALYYEQGPPFLQRYLPFWAASLIDRLKVMLLPLIVLLFPLVKIMPPIYSWRMRARVYRWYEQLEQAELQLADENADRAMLKGELDRIEAEVRRINVPLSFADRIYHLRQHIDLVRRKAAM